MGIIFVLAQIINVYIQIKANKESKLNFDLLASNLESRVNAAFNMLLSGHKDRYPTFQESIDNFNLYRQLSSGDHTRSNISLFSFRMQHYSDEKEYICRKCIEHIKDKFKNKDGIYLMIDSGSTVFPIFKLLCDYYWLFSNDEREILSKIKMITNNLPGVNTILLFGRKDSSVNAEMIYCCKILPGCVDGKYSAILDIECANHLNWTIHKEREDNKKDNKDIVFISIITGNYISINDGVLWRGENHGAMKDAYIYNSDYVYILSPLGKIFDKTCNEINDIQTMNNPFIKRYHTLNDINNFNCIKFMDENGKDRSIELKSENDLFKFMPRELNENHKDNVYLFTTKRIEKNDSYYPKKLGKYFAVITNKLEDVFEENLKIFEFDPEVHSGNVKHQLHYCVSQREDIFYEYEFPHAEIRSSVEKEIKSKF